MQRLKKYATPLSALMLLLVVGCKNRGEQDVAAIEEIIEPQRQYGVVVDGYTADEQRIKQGQTLGRILSSYGVSARQIDKLDKSSKSVFPLRNIRGGNRYVAYLRDDSTRMLDYLVYKINELEYVRFELYPDLDSVAVARDARATEVRRNRREAVINSSMWGAIMEAKLPYALGSSVEEIYQWSVNFFALQKGDSFTIIYDEMFVDDSVSVGVGRVWGAKFNHGGREYYAIPYDQNGRIEYWETNGDNLRKQMLKAPLKFSRISSKFTYSRLHPIHKVYRPHTGVDYAAPMGTPVQSVADGVVTFRGWGAGGAGNMIKIKHPNNITTGYLHLRGFAKGLKVGSKVRQGEVIGYVGSTGASTGPHLDYRVWKGTTPIDPLKIPQEPTEPISEENKERFNYIMERIVAELDYDPADSTAVAVTPIVDITAEVIDSLIQLELQMAQLQLLEDAKPQQTAEEESEPKERRGLWRRVKSLFKKG